MTAMEPIDETRELTSNEEAASSGHNPLLNEAVLKSLFAYFSIPDLKRAREVCEYWKYSATPYLREKTVVRLEGVCPLCKSEWKSNSKKIAPHDHKETISLYRFILQAQTMLLKEREEVFYKNFHISQLNLYFIPRLRPEPTKYFLSFIKLLGHKVFHLTLDNVQFCPTESVYRILSLFKNLERVSYNNVSVWVDPVSKNSKDGNDDDGKIPKTSISTPSPISVSVSGPQQNSHPLKTNDFLRSITISGDWVSEEFLSWERIFRASPQLNELNFLEVPKNEILNSISTLVTLSQDEVRLRKLVILPRGRMEDQLDFIQLTSAANLDCTSDLEDEDDEYSESESSSDNNHFNYNHNKNKINFNLNKNRYSSEDSKGEEMPPNLNSDSNLNPNTKKKLELESLNFNHLLTQAMTSFPITELTLRLPYHGEEGMKFPDILRAGVDKLNSLDLCRHSTLFYSQTQVQFKHGPFESERERERDRDRDRERNRQESNKNGLNSEFLIFPFIKKLSLAHNFIDNFDEIKTSFPSLESLCVNIIPTEFNPRKSKSYHTYLRTTLMLSMKNASVNPSVRELVWNIEEPRNPKTGIRTVVYKTNALRHLPKIFTGLVKLSVSITRPSDLHVIFRDLDKLQELTVLKNSFYRTKDEDIIGWADCDSDSSDSESDSDSETEYRKNNHGNDNVNDNDDAESSGIESKNSADSILNRQRRKTKILPNPGIKQLKNLKRLSLENNNCCLTNKSLRHGFSFLQNLQYLHISRGKKITLSALRILTRCPYLTDINVTSPNCGNFPSDEELVAAYQHAIITQPLLDIWNGKDKPIENQNQPQQDQQQQQQQQENQPQPQNPETPQETLSPTDIPSERFKKSKIPSLVNRYTPPPSTRYSTRTRTKTKTKSRNQTHFQTQTRVGGILPSLVSTSRKTTTRTTSKNVYYVKDNNLTLPPIANKTTGTGNKSGVSYIPAPPPPVSASVLSLGAGLAMSLPVSPLRSKKKPEDIHPELEATDLKYILSLSESELEKYEEANKKNKVMRKKKSDEPRGGAIRIKITGTGTGTGAGTVMKMSSDKKSVEKIPNQNEEINLMTLLAHDLNIPSKKLVTGQKGGKYEKGEKYDKIGGRRYFFVRTKYKVNGRMYSLVRRKYENEGEKEKIYAKQRAWLARKRLQQTREAAKLKNGKRSGFVEELDEQALAALRKSIEENEEESEYERSIKEYDEDDEMDELEEYCDEDNIDNDDLVTPVTSEEEGSDSETSAEEGIFMDDPYYEGDKEFYDSGGEQDQVQEDDKKLSEQKGDQQKQHCEKKNENKSSASKEKSGKSESEKSENVSDQKTVGKKSKRVSFQNDEEQKIQTTQTRTRTRTRTKTRTKMRTKNDRNDRNDPISPNNGGPLINRSQSRSRSRSQSRCSHYDSNSPTHLYSRSHSSCTNHPLSLYPEVIEYKIPPKFKFKPDSYSYDYRIANSLDHGNDGNMNLYRKSTVKNIENIERSSSRLDHLDHFNAGLDFDLDFDSDFNSSNSNIIRTVQTVEKINVEKIVEIRKKPEIPSPAFELELERAVEKMNQELHAPPQTMNHPIRSPIRSPSRTKNHNADDGNNNNYNSQMSENEQESAAEFESNSSQSRKKMEEYELNQNQHQNPTDSESCAQDLEEIPLPIRSKYGRNSHRFQQEMGEIQEPRYDTAHDFEKSLVNMRSKIAQELQDDAFKTKPKVIPTFD